MANTDEQDILNEVGQTFGNDGLAGIGARASGMSPGTAVFQVENAYLSRTKNGVPQMVATCKCLEHDTEVGCVGRNYFKNWNLTTPKNFEWLNGDMVNLELGMVKAKEDLPKRCAELIGIVFSCNLVENQDPKYPPVSYINPGARRKDREGKNNPTAKANIPI